MSELFDSQKLVTIAENQQKVYEAGYEKGKEDGGDKHYDTFWDTYQDNGNRTHYAYGFAGRGWDDAVFKPKYPITSIENAASMFSNNMYLGSIPYDLDFSNSADCSYAFSQCISLKSIKSVKFNNTLASSKNASIFAACNSLKTISIVGTIGFTLSLNVCPLNKDSILSVVNALDDTTTGLKLTLKKTAVNAAFTTEEWSALTDTKPNWTFTLS